MSIGRVAAAIRITSPDEARMIQRASAFSLRTGSSCFVISIVSRLPDDAMNDEDRRIVAHNLALIAAAHATPVMLEGGDVPRSLIDAATFFGIATLFIHRGRTAERLIRLRPPFDVIVSGEDRSTA